ncbi:hypothetical protein GCM10028806_28540 [Spirosoma terrae]|uniref:Uncharacterized protein n=1 Tax=Spirosoma terrae TaxID=1968276 RepID=A0A6L9L9E5_9BACT|nr:hypothetical protein [Spirosoma terrae]NDU97186.1 hypothetical protein [Spirosoma terrae]
MGTITFGVSSIEMGAIGNDGGPGTVLEALGKTNQNSCNLNQDEPTTTEFRSEEDDQPIYSTETPGPIALTYQIVDPDLDAMEKLFGGEITGSAGSRVWNMPASIISLEQTVKVTPKEGLKLTIPRAKVVARFTGEFTKANPFVLEVTATALTPEKTGVGALVWAE